MILPRIYYPKDNDILYHYCDENAFLAVCVSKKMRFSDISSMNDFMEINWGYNIWREAAAELTPEIGHFFLDVIDQGLIAAKYKGFPLAACFSLNGDVLSQWRAYADDGRGFAIGFDAKSIIEIPARPMRILYDKRQQIEELKLLLFGIYEAELYKKDKFRDDFQKHILNLSGDITSFKSPSFAEENEVRLLRMLEIRASNNFIQLINPCESGSGKGFDGINVLFRMRNGTPIPFIELDFTNDGQSNPIREIVVGPKNNVPEDKLSLFLETVGLGNVEIKESSAPYR
jgi:hypothetical protein